MPIKTLIARQLLANIYTHTHRHTHAYAHTHTHTHTHTHIKYVLYAHTSQTSSNIDYLFQGGPRNHLLSQTSMNLQQPGIDEWEISPSEVMIEDFLGEGEFGKVYKGVVKGPLTCTKVRPALRNRIAVLVAVKLLKGEQLE